MKSNCMYTCVHTMSPIYRSAQADNIKVHIQPEFSGCIDTGVERHQPTPVALYKPALRGSRV